MKYVYLLAVIVFSLFVAPLAYSSMTGGDFEIYADVIGVLDSQYSSGGDYTLYDTMGEGYATSTSGGTLTLTSGFQALSREGLSFSLSASSVDLGELSPDSVSSDAVVITAGTEAITGYTISVSESSNLQDGSGNTINDVNDGSVSAGSEEYGIRTSGSAGLLTSDTGISGSVSVATRNVSMGNDQTTVSFLASIDNNTVAGTYSHTVTFSIVANP